jgi:CheY-like chemotaxis protein
MIGNSGAVGLLLSQDLFFGSRITGTAEQLGMRIDTAAGLAQALDKLGQEHYRAIFIDLSVPSLSIAELIAALPHVDRPRVLAFGSHVHTALLEQARAAGCDEVLTRGRFSADLLEILRTRLAEQ